MDHDLSVLRGTLEENSKEISSVALLSPACYSFLPLGLGIPSLGMLLKLVLLAGHWVVVVEGWGRYSPLL